MANPSETDVGITEFVSTLPGFNSILKHRFRDFQVREVDPKGRVARLTSLQPEAQMLASQTASGGTAPGAATPTPAPASGKDFSPVRLAASRLHLVTSFSATAGPENGALLDDLLKRIIGSKERGQPQMSNRAGSPAAKRGPEGGAGGGAADAAAVDVSRCSGESVAPGGEAIAARAATAPPVASSDGLHEPEAAGGAAAAPAAATADAAATTAADLSEEARNTAAPEPRPGSLAVAESASASNMPPAVAMDPSSGSAATAAGDAGTAGGGDSCVLERVSVLLLPIASKDARKAVHEFFRTMPGLPPMRTETVTLQPPQQQQGQQQQKQQQQQESSDHEYSLGDSGAKRGRTDGADEGPPAKMQRGGGRDRGRGGDGGPRRRSGREGADGGGGGSGEGQQQEQLKGQPQAQTVHRIEVIFDPRDLNESGADGAAAGCRGRGGGGRGRGRGRPRVRDRGDWEGGPHPFVRFVLYKENVDTQVALSTVGRLLGITGGNCFGFAGTKDKRGVTCQFATAFKVAPSRLSALNDRLRGIRLGSFSFSDEGLRLGCLAGNEFHLLLRDVRPAGQETAAAAATATGTEAVAVDLIAQVTAACEAVARNGFINYFGLQRFGSGGAPTHVVGRALLRCEYEKAVHLVLTGRPDERPDIAAARRLYFEAGDVKGALRGIPQFMLGERAVLGALVRHGATAWSAAMLAVPRTLRMMYLHAWQSFVWNSAASHRIRTYGNDRVVAGDLVMPRGMAVSAAGGNGGGGDGGGGGEGSALLDADLGGDVGEVADVMLDGASGGEGAAVAATTISAARRLPLVRLVADADVTAGRYSIFDVVLPLPGTEVLYPVHETGDWIRKAAAEAGVDLDQPAASSVANRELSFASLSGDYRYLLHRPKDFHFAFKRYTNPNDDSLMLTDLELLQKKGRSCRQQPPPVPAHAAADHATLAQQHQHQQEEKEKGQDGEGLHRTEGSPGTGTERGDGEGGNTSGGGEGHSQPCCSPAVSGIGPLLALELRFQLPSSCYATMLLRDLTKVSTSKAFHAGLSTAVGTGVVAAASPLPAAAAAAEHNDSDGLVQDLDSDGLVQRAHLG